MASSDDDFDLSTSQVQLSLSRRTGKNWRDSDDDDDLSFGDSDQEESGIELAKACEDGDVAEVKRLLAESPDVNVNFKDEMDLTPLIYATQRGLIEVVHLLLQKGANVNLKGDEGKTALFHACRRGKAAIVRILLENGAHVDATDEELKTPLFYAAMQGRSEILEELLAHGAQLALKDEDGRTALFYALECDHVHLANTLLTKAKEASIDLIAGSDYGDNELLLKCMTNADVNAVDAWGKTALIYACKRDCVETVKYLLTEKQAFVNFKIAKNGMTPLLIACKKNKAHIAKLLIEHNADLNVSDSQQRSPLWYSINNRMPDTSKMLIERGADINRIDCDGHSVLWRAFNKDEINTAKLLLAKGADILPQGGFDYGEETLLFASLSGAPIDKADEKGMTPLLYACKNGQMRLAKYLLVEKHAAANSTDVQGRNCLHFLAPLQQRSLGARKLSSSFIARDQKLKDQSNQERLEVAELLLAHGCNVNAKAHGISAFYTACLEGDLDLAKLFIENCADVNAIGEAADEMQLEQTPDDGDSNTDEMNIEEWTDDEAGWDDNSSSDGEEVYKAKGKEPEPQARHNSRRSRSKSYRERVNIFQTDREEEAIGESGEDEMNLGKGPLLINIIRRLNQKNLPSGDFEKNYFEIIKLLVENGADVNVKDDTEGRTPLLWACLLRNKKIGMRIAQLLLGKGLDVQEKDKGGNSALLLATAVGNKKIVKHLLSETKVPVDVNQKNTKGYTALVTAIQDNYKVRAMADLRGNLPIAKLLITHGADVNLIGGGHKPLYFACSAGNLDMVKLLVENGADVNHKEPYSTPLITAILKGNPAVVKYLVQKGASVQMKVGGKDSLYFASMRGLRDIIRILKQGNAPHSDKGSDCEVDDWGEQHSDRDGEEDWEKGEESAQRRKDMSLFKQQISSVVLQDDDDEW